MKNTRIILLAFSALLFTLSCEKEETNPFIGTWEDYTTTARGSNTTTMVYRSDMTMLFTMVVTVDGQDTTTSTEYNYFYTSATITIWKTGGEEEETEYMINDNYLVLSPGTDFELTLTKTN